MRYYFIKISFIIGIILIGFLHTVVAQSKWIGVWDDTLSFNASYPISEVQSIDTIIRQLNLNKGEWLLCVYSDKDTISQYLKGYAEKVINVKNKYFFRLGITDLINFEFYGLDSNYKTPFELLPDGHWIYWVSTSKASYVLWEIYIREGKFYNTIKQYDSTGKQVQQITYNDKGLKNGVQWSRDIKTKNITSEFVFRDGKAIEEVRYYYWIRKDFKMFYKSQSELIQKSWDENGVLRNTTQLNVNMQRNGLVRTWYSDGKKEFEGQYKNDNKYGIWKYYNTRGELINEEDYTETINK